MGQIKKGRKKCFSAPSSAIACAHHRANMHRPSWRAWDLKTSIFFSKTSLIYSQCWYAGICGKKSERERLRKASDVFADLFPGKRTGPNTRTASRLYIGAEELESCWIYTRSCRSNKGLEEIWVWITREQGAARLQPLDASADVWQRERTFGATGPVAGCSLIDPPNKKQRVQVVLYSLVTSLFSPFNAPSSLFYFFLLCFSLFSASLFNVFSQLILSIKNQVSAGRRSLD